MDRIAIFGVGDTPIDLINSIAAAVSSELDLEVILVEDRLDPGFARDTSRGQYTRQAY